MNKNEKRTCKEQMRCDEYQKIRYDWITQRHIQTCKQVTKIKSKNGGKKPQQEGMGDAIKNFIIIQLSHPRLTITLKLVMSHDEL